MLKNRLLNFINFPTFVSLRFFNIKKERFLLIKHKEFLFYFFLPFFVKCYLYKNVFNITSNILFSTQDKLKVLLFQSSILNFLSFIKIPYKKKLILRGLGFRLNLFADQNVLTCKLGYSHLISVSIDNSIKSIKIKKNKISIESFHKQYLGNFVSRLIRLKKPDSYKGKGFWHKNQLVVLKVTKKK